MKDEIILKGWNFMFMDVPISEDILISSLHSKQIKFLQFKNEFPLLFNGNDILYFDHKVEITDDHVHYLHEISKQNPSIEIIIRRHEDVVRNTIHAEINDAVNYMERYRRHMPETIDYITKYIFENNLSFETTICNTGILYYHNVQHTNTLLSKIYDASYMLQQPECQVFWATFSQQYKPFIFHINFNDIIARWHLPS